MECVRITMDETRKCMQKKNQKARPRNEKTKEYISHRCEVHNSQMQRAYDLLATTTSDCRSFSC
jgi:hypothetical protein